VAGVRASSAARTASMLRSMWWPIKSKRKPSTLYCVAQVSTLSTISFSIMACSVAVFWQQVLVSTWPSAFRRW
jgi:hypothetical protein